MLQSLNLDSLENSQYIDRIENIAKKYELIENDQKFDIKVAAKAIVEYINSLSYRYINVPEDAKTLFFSNNLFIKNLNIYLEDLLNSLLKNDTNYFFKDITTILNIFSVGANYEIFNDFKGYNINSISKLLRFLEKKLVEIKDLNSQLFELKFDSYVILLKSLSQLCVINSTDIISKNNINNLIEIMSESINTLKYQIQLDEKSMCKLNNLLGTHLYYFSHLKQVEVNENNYRDAIKIYLSIFQRIEDGYLLSKDWNFGNLDSSLENKEEYVIFRTNCSLLILEALEKFEKLSILQKDYFENKDFDRLISHYHAHSTSDEKKLDITELSVVKDLLLDSLTLKYKFDNPNRFVNHKSIINDLQFSVNSFSKTNFGTIYYILRFRSDYDDITFKNVGNILSETKKINNDYHEYYKLKIFDLIIEHFMHRPFSVEVKELFEKINHYIEINKTASHLFFIYSKIYLGIALFFSKHTATITKAKIIYSFYIQTNGLIYLKEKYLNTNLAILKNFGSTYVKELEINKYSYSDEELINLGKQMIKQYIIFNDYEVKFKVNNDFTVISNKIFKKEFEDFISFEKQISKLISNKIFQGLCDFHILGFNKEASKIVDAGYDQYISELDSNYAIQFIFPAILKNNFMHILESNKQYINQNVNTLVSLFNYYYGNFTDKLTGFYKYSKLADVVKHSNKERIGFIEIFVKALVDLEDAYTLNISKDIFKIVCKEIQKNCDKNDIFFKLNGYRLGILLEHDREYISIFNKLKNFTINYDNININIQFISSFTYEKKDNLLFKASRNIDKAILYNIEQYIGKN